MARKDAAKASSLPVDRYRKEIGNVFRNLFAVCSVFILAYFINKIVF